MSNILRDLFFLLIVRPVMLVILGMNVRHRERLPKEGPAMIVANHNSHLDALALMTVFNSRQLRNVHPVAAIDYFYKNRFLKWFATRLIGIVPLSREARATGGHPLAAVDEAISQNNIIILFPEGTRGDPEQLMEFKTGVAHLAKRHPDIDIVPVFMHGFGKALPRGEAILVPFFCDVFVGESFHWTGERETFMSELNDRISRLAEEGRFPDWS